MPASAAMARIVARSYPSSAKRRRAAVRIAFRVSSDHCVKGMANIVGQRLLANVFKGE